MPEFTSDVTAYDQKVLRESSPDTRSAELQLRVTEAALKCRATGVGVEPRRSPQSFS